MKEQFKFIFGSFLNGLAVTFGGISAYEIYNTVKDPYKRAKIKSKFMNAKDKIIKFKED